jgi:feruloyl esterase
MENYFRYMVFEDPTWNPLTAKVDTALQTADEKTARALNATETDLHNFQARGGKLILYHGWNDPAISPANSINYYNGVIHAMGAPAAEGFVRLYMVPGMQHCMGGPGPNSFGQLGTTTAKGPEHGIYDALEQWVEKGTAPGAIVATKYIDDNSAKGVRMTRPLCSYPQIAIYKGTGDSNDYASFDCKTAR